MKDFRGKVKSIFNAKVLLVLILYSLSFGLLFLNNGAYWDDWAVFVGKTPEYIKQQFFSAGIFLAPYLYNFINLFNSYLVYRAITFVVYLLSGFCLLGILKTIKEIDTLSRFLIVTFFLLFPANDSRVMLIIFSYTIAHFFFYLGWWLASLYLKNRFLLIRLVALISFFAAFSINSFILFYVLVLAYIGYSEKDKLHTWRNVFELLFHYTDFVLLPLVFLFIRVYFFTASGSYQEYNKIMLINIITAFYRSFTAYWNSFLSVVITTFKSLLGLFFGNSLLPLGTNLINTFNSISPFRVVIILSGLLLLIICLRNIFQKESRTKFLSKSRLLFFLGAVMLYMAVYPYYVVNKAPSITLVFSDRHLLLVPLGASFMIVYGMQIISQFLKLKPNTIIVAYSLIIFSFASYHLRANINYLEYWTKELAIMAEMKKSEVLHNYTTFLFVDKTEELDINHTPISYYEYTGYMKAVFGNEKRFGSNVADFMNGINFIQVQKYDKSVYPVFSKSILKSDFQKNTEVPRNFLSFKNSLLENKIKYIFPNKNGFTKRFADKYNMRDYVLKDPEYIIEIDHGPLVLSDKNLFRLMYERCFDNTAFNREIGNVVRLSSSKILQND